MYLATTSADLKLYNCDEWNLKLTYGTQKEPIKCLRWSDDGRYLLQISSTNGAEILCVNDDKIRPVQRISIEEPTAGSFYRDGARYIGLGTKTGKISIWDTKSKNVFKSFHTTESSVVSLDFNQKNTLMAVAYECGDIIYYGITTNSQLGTVKMPRSNTPNSVLFHRDYRSLLAVSTEEGSILLRDLSSSKDRMFADSVHAAPVSGMSFSPVNKDVMVSCSYDKKLHVHDIRLQTVVSTVVTDRYLSCANLNAGGLVALGANKGEVIVYDLRNYKKPLQFKKDHSTKVNHVQFQPAASKKNHTFNISIKEVVALGSPHLKFPKSPERSGCSEIMDIISPFEKPNARSNVFDVDDTDLSHNLFMENVIDLTNNSQASLASDIKSKFVKSACDASGKIDSVSTSTPVDIAVSRFNRKPDVDAPSPIISLDLNANGGSPMIPDIARLQEMHYSKKSVDSPAVDHGSAVETVKCDQNLITELGCELKNYIRHTMSDVLSDNWNHFVQATMQHAKNRIYLEDQISILNENMRSMHQTLLTILEENKRLRIDIEMLRASKNDPS